MNLVWNRFGRYTLRYAGGIALGFAAWFGTATFEPSGSGTSGIGTWGITLGLAEAHAQDDEEERGPRRSSRRTRIPRESVIDVYNLVQGDPEVEDDEGLLGAEQYDQAARAVQGVIAQGLEDFEQALLYQLLVAIEASRENYPGAIEAAQSAIGTGALEPDQVLGLRFQLGILYTVIENYDAAIRELTWWLDNAENPSPNAAVSVYAALAQAHAAKEDWPNVIPNALQAIELSPEPRESHHSQLAVAYLQLDRTTDARPLLEKMVRLWPTRKSYWSQLGSAYYELGEEQRSFANQLLMYEQGFLTSSTELMNLGEFYFFYENPYHGAQIIEEQLAAGRIEATSRNLEKLGNAWYAARERDKAREVLIRAARNSSDGDIDYRISSTYAEEENWSEAERFLNRALDKGGLNDSDQGNAWYLLGSIRFERGNRSGAQAAFRQARRFNASRRQAESFLSFINDQIRQEQAQQARVKIEAASEVTAASVETSFEARAAAQEARQLVESIQDASDATRAEAEAAALDAIAAAREKITDAVAEIERARVTEEEALALVPDDDEFKEVLNDQQRTARARREEAMVLARQNLEQAIEEARTTYGLDVPAGPEDEASDGPEATNEESGE